MIASDSSAVKRSCSQSICVIDWSAASRAISGGGGIREMNRMLKPGGSSRIPSLNAKRHGASVSSVAIAWALAWQGVTGAIVGARTPKQVDGWVGAASLTLMPQDLDEIAAAIRRTKAGAG